MPNALEIMVQTIPMLGDRRDAGFAHAAAASSSAMTDDTRRRVSFVLIVLGTLGGLPYVILPILSSGRFCPATTFGSGTMASTFLYTGGSANWS